MLVSISSLFRKCSLNKNETATYGLYYSRLNAKKQLFLKIEKYADILKIEKYADLSL